MAPTEESKADKRADLAKEVKMTVHLKNPLDGVCEIADEFGFPRPADIGAFMATGLTTAQADAVRERHHFNMLTPPPSSPCRPSSASCRPPRSRS